MERKQLLAVLVNHGISYRIDWAGRVIALEAGTQRLASGEVVGVDSWVDVSDWTRGKLAKWLGY